MEETVFELKKALKKSIEHSKFEQSCDLLQRLSEITATKELLKKTEIGIEISKLKKHAEPKVASLALKVLNKWKRDVGILKPPPTTTSTTNTTTNSNSSHSSNAIPTSTSSSMLNSVPSANASASSTPSPSLGPCPSNPTLSPELDKASTSTSSREQQTTFTNQKSSVSSTITTPLPTITSTSTSSSPTSSPPPADPHLTKDISETILPSSSSSSSPSETSHTNGDRGSSSTPTDTFPERSVSLDQVTIPCTGNPTRNKCIEMLYNALCVTSPLPSDSILHTSCLLERTLLDKYQGQVTSEYKADVRMFFANLKHKQNATLREAVLSGTLTVSKFIRMTPAEMAPGSLKKEMEEMKKMNLFLARAAGNTKAETDLFKCNKCKKRRTSYYQLQTRSADEPMTTFVECLECGNHWKFC